MKRLDVERLAETVRGNRSLLSEDAGAPAWHYCVVTASSRRQASLYEWELGRRRERGLFPKATQVLSVADPPGVRVGSGGGALWALRAVAKDISRRLPASGKPDVVSLLGRRRILIVQCGGDSRRAPLHTATGKLFARLPVTLPDGHCSCVFDELWAVLRGLTAGMKAGIVVASGDVLLAFGPEQVAFPASGVTGIACWADVDTGTRHGVYVAGENGAVKLFLQKASARRLRAEGAVNARGRVAVDSGILAFTGAAASALARLARPASGPGRDLLSQTRKNGIPLDLYTHFTEALLHDDDPTAAGAGGCDEAAAVLRRHLGTARFRVIVPDPSLFTHLGSTELFRDRLTRDAEVRTVYGWEPVAASSAGVEGRSASAVVMGSALLDADARVRSGAVVTDVQAAGRLDVGKGAIVSHLDVPPSGLTVRSGTVVMTLPVRVGGKWSTVALVYGVRDDPRQPLTSPECTYLGQPLRDWLRSRRITQRLVWPDVPPKERTLWNARLFPIVPRTDREGALKLALWMQGDVAAARENVAAWAKATRIAFADLADAIDPQALVRRRERLDAQVAAHLAIEDIERTGDAPLEPAISSLGDRARAQAVRSLAGYGRRATDPLRRCRALKALADVAARLRAPAVRVVSDSTRRALRIAAGVEEGAPPRRIDRELNRRAFAEVAEAVKGDRRGPPACSPAIDLGQAAVAEAPVRVDLAGGWTDTPPYCLERGGAVVNVALNLEGRSPVRAVARPLSELLVRLVSEDQNARLQTTRLNSLVNYARPEDPLAILKAALFASSIIGDRPAASLREMLTRFGAGIELRVRCDVPKGSGLGASSVMGCAILAALAALCGRELTEGELLDDVLQLEQMLTTGGGWQDQVGGAIGGVKLTTSEPGAPQRLRIRRIDIAPEVKEELSRRMMLFYTGRTRVAKNILQTVMGRYISREPTAVAALSDLTDLALEISRALEAGDLDDVGRLMGEQWEHNKILDPESTDPYIDSLFDAVAPYVSGAKLAGAGGGGFMVIMRKGERSAPSAARVAGRLTGFTDGRPYPFEMNGTGLQVSIDPVGRDAGRT